MSFDWNFKPDGLLNESCLRADRRYNEWTYDDALGLVNWTTKPTPLPNCANLRIILKLVIAINSDEQSALMAISLKYLIFYSKTVVQ